MQEWQQGIQVNFYNSCMNLDLWKESRNTCMFLLSNLFPPLVLYEWRSLQNQDIYNPSLIFVGLSALIKPTEGYQDKFSEIPYFCASRTVTTNLLSIKFEFFSSADNFYQLSLHIYLNSFFISTWGHFSDPSRSQYASFTLLLFIILEHSFNQILFSIPNSDTLNMGFRQTRVFLRTLRLQLDLYAFCGNN